MQLEKKLTILVNSCDAYEDLWVPFFTLLKKYGNIPGVQILLNTESREFAMDGIQINCIHSPKGTQYGGRILRALDNVKTEYVLLMLDDFFLRRPLNAKHIGQLLDWMDADPQIACFNSEQVNCYASWEKDRYPGYTRIPPANSYACNMQAAVWRTDKLKKYWKPKVSPWEWEEYCSLLTARFTEDKLYCRTENGQNWIDYGHYRTGDLWAVVRGKWIVSDVKELFKREDIVIDFSQRGIYLNSEMKAVSFGDAKRGGYISRIARCLGISFVCKYISYRLRQIICVNSQEQQLEFLEYIQEKAKKRFLKKQEGNNG